MVRELSPALSGPELEVHSMGTSVFTVRGLEALVGIEMHEGSYTGELGRVRLFIDSFGWLGH